MGGAVMDTPQDHLIATIRAGLARCQRRWFRALSLALDPDEVTLAEQIVAQTILEELGTARYQARSQQ